MKAKKYKRVKPTNTGKTHDRMPLVIYSEVRRNEPCPCGRTRVIEGTDRVIPMKFKNCCSTKK